MRVSRSVAKRQYIDVREKIKRKKRRSEAKKGGRSK